MLQSLNVKKKNMMIMMIIHSSILILIIGMMGSGVNPTCEDDVGDVAVVTVSQLLGVLQAAASEAHHGRLGVVEGGALAEQAGRADGVLDHVELLQLEENHQVVNASVQVSI